MANEYQIETKARLLALAEASDFFCNIGRDFIFMSNGAQRVIIPVNQQMNQPQLALYIEQLCRANGIREEINVGDPDAIDRTLNRLQAAVVDNQSYYDDNQYQLYSDRLLNTQEQLRNNIFGYLDPQYRDEAMEITTRSENFVDNISNLAMQQKIERESSPTKA